MKSSNESRDNLFLFEVSWEVCNKVGGIYTVIKSKLAESNQFFQERYILVGPLFNEENSEFVEDDAAESLALKKRFEQAGLTTRVGHWNLPERPKVVLVGFHNLPDKDKILYEFWEEYGVESITGGWDYVEPVLFAAAAAKVIIAATEYYEEKNDRLQSIGHFHEWMTGGGLLYLKLYKPDIATVFTTHATVLGRSLAGNGIDLYMILNHIESHSEAARFNVMAKHSMETVTARESDCFTTVSDITALEARHILDIKADRVLPNGFNVKGLPDYKNDKKFFEQNRQKLLQFCTRFFNKPLKDEETVVISTSGRYEYHNKGLDLIIESLGEIYKRQSQFKRQVIVLFLVVGGNVDMYREVKVDETGLEQLVRYSGISTHPLHDFSQDPIVRDVQKYGMHNNPDDKLNIAYIPVYLNGRDGVVNMEYYDALAACDLTVFPSYYEPWGYTPLESIAYSVPTITSDLAGFGRWIIARKIDSASVGIVRRFARDFESARGELSVLLESFINNLDKKQDLKREARTVALQADWSVFYDNYIKAYKFAVTERNNRLEGLAKAHAAGAGKLIFTGTDTTRPRLRQFSIQSYVPKEIADLNEIANNLWWSWNKEGVNLFGTIDNNLLNDVDHNPVAFLQVVSSDRLKEISHDHDYLQDYRHTAKNFKEYLNYKPCLLKSCDHITAEHPVAYFSMEYALHECLPVYSGGLGVLSGDHVKTASDLNIPFVAVGLLYKNGYFKQGIAKDGEQKVEYYNNDFGQMPLEEIKSRKGEKLLIKVELPGRTLYARVWVAKVGRAKLYFFDSDIEQNTISDREITGKLYGGGKKVRIEQEILLGIGGVRLLEDKLGLTPSVYHLNEGHSGFLIVERLVRLMERDKLDLNTAREVVKASTVFTTHTPVPAGNETFELSLIENYFKNYLEKNNFKLRDLFEMGHKKLSDTGPLEMTVLALKNSYKRNGVSRLHGIIARRMWADLWRSFLMEEIPIGHITNGVHVSTWLTSEMKQLIGRHTSLDFNEDLLKKEKWDKVEDVPDAEIWEVHAVLKQKLFTFIKKKITINWEREGEDPALLGRFLSNLNPLALTIGFSRRMAMYKRPMLIFRNRERLKKLLLNPEQPVQIVIAGKAHPNDTEAHGIIREIVQLSKEQDFLGKIIFLEGYDMRVARRLVSGADVWLNNPRRPYEASGTSGQKAAINGVINFSILDGWWDEGFIGSNGWAIGQQREYNNTETQDIIDSDSLYEILEKEIVPLFYQRNKKNVPLGWIKTMKASIISGLSEFNTNRMVREYYEKMYVPAAEKGYLVKKDGYQTALAITEWKKSIRARFASVHVVSLSVSGIYGDNLIANQEIEFMLELNPGKMSTDEILPEVMLYKETEPQDINYSDKRRLIENQIQYLPLNLIEETELGLKYLGKYKAEITGKFNYGIRIIPFNKDLDDVMDLNLVIWV